MRRLLPTLLAFALVLAPSLPAAAQDTPTTVPPAPALAKPDGDTFVILADGSFVAADAVSAAEGDVVVKRLSGSEEKLPKSKVSLAWSGGKKVWRGEEAGLHQAWLQWLQAVHVDPLPTKKVKDADPAVKAAWWADLLAAADRCAELFPKSRYAAAALLAEGIDAGTWDEEAQRRAVEWEPLEFQFSSEDEVRSKLLAVWAREIIPFGGQWVLRTETHSRAARSSLWTQDAKAVRTRNLLIFSLDDTPAVVGSLLRQGERTIRELERLFGVPDIANPDPLEIRLFKDRQQYLTEGDGGGGYAPIWTAGFFSPGEGVSRFYVPRLGGKTDKFNETELHETLSHELTHQWLEMRFLAGVEYRGEGDRRTSERKKDSGRHGEQPGHWIVEGIARFVEDQMVLPWGKGEVKFDNPGNESCRDAAGQWRSGLGLPISRYLEITPVIFHQALSDVPRRGSGGGLASERQVFYDQGGALCFFMMNRRGADGRKRLLQYLEDVYAGKMTKESWTRLGFASALELEKEFSAFLASVK